MTIQEFAVKCGTKEATVVKWLEAGYVLGTTKVDGVFCIPQSARKPYTKNRAKTGSAILKSIVKACDLHLGICAAIYKISEAEFSGYIDALVHSQMIDSYQDDGITYYHVTDKGVDWLKNQSRKKDWLSLIGTGASVVSAVSAAIPLIAK
jgi:predicted transcriptional regulator